MLTTFQKPDAEIVAQVVQELRWDCRTEKCPIRVVVENGVVTLTGHVHYFANKHAAEEAAHRIAGVRQVVNDLVVMCKPADYRADWEIAQAVHYVFRWNVLVPEKQIEVEVQKGIVHLSGTVNCLSQREEAERAITNLLGVKGISNMLAVQPQSVAAETVCTDIQHTLERQAVAVASTVTVEVEQGEVRLSGSVPSWNERCALLSAAGFAHGIQRIVDDLQVTGFAPVGEPLACGSASR